MPRYLLGPVAASFNADSLAPNQDARFFGPAGEQQLTLAADTSWDDLLKQLPADWRPDYLVLWLPYTAIPPKLWQAPVPIIGLAPDSNLLAHAYRRILPRCDLVFCDAPSASRWRQAGLDHVRPLNLFGVGPAHLAALSETISPESSRPRDLDVLFVGNLHPGVQRQRNRWLGRLAALSSRWNIAIRSGVFGDDYRALLQRAKIVFNLSIRGECNRRVAEAIAAGALLFQEADNAEVAALLRPGVEYVPYKESNLEALLAHYLTHDDERTAIASAARARLPELTFASFWQQGLDSIEQQRESIEARRQQRLAQPFVPSLEAALWSAASGGQTLELVSALEKSTSRPLAAVAAGLVVAEPEQAARLFDRALDLDPAHPVAGLNRAEVLARLGNKDDAIVQARQTLFHLERNRGLSAEALDAPHLPLGFDLFRVEWEQALWQNLADRDGESAAKRSLLRSRLHSLLGEWTGDLAHYAEAVLARPDLPTLQATYGSALARGGRFAEAVPHLRAAVEADPFDAQAARVYFQLLGDVGDFAGRAAFARTRHAQHRAAPGIIAGEEWFTHPPLSGSERTSIIVLACNQAELTRLCLDSVLHFTTGDYELILVDNGSTDDVPALFEEMKSRSGPARVEVIRNADNVGFPKGVNQGIAAAQGEYLVLLNNDTVVTPGWLDGLINWALHDWPMVGMVGPLSNQAPPPQQLEAGYRDLAGLEPFARRLRRHHTGQALEVQRVTGFCLLIRKAVLAAIGGTLDERFGVGFFEDDDLCLRTRQAGFKLLVAKDIYIHHFGNRTFQALQLDAEQHLRDNFQRFREKWGNEAAAPYRMADGSSPADTPIHLSAPRIEAGPPLPSSNGHVPAPAPSLNGTKTTDVGVPCSLCIMVKNEEKNLADCIGPLRDLFKDIVVVDTGSTDRTRELAQRLGARVFDFPWVDSFAAARNETLRHARGRFIFWMDADDRIDPENVGRLKELLQNLPDANVAYSMKCLCVARAPGETSTVVDHVRLFRNDPRIRWEHRVHEQILPGVKRSGGRALPAPIVIRHLGYTDPALRARKLERDLRLLKLEEKELPDHPFTLFNLGSHYHEVNQPAEAIPYLQRSLAASHPKDSIVRKLYATIAQCQRALNRTDEALATCAAGRKVEPEDAELLFLEGTLLREVGNRSAAVERFTRLLEGKDDAHFGSVDTGLRGYKARQNLAACYLEQNRLAEAEAQLHAALMEEPAFQKAQMLLGEVLVRQGAWDRVEKYAEEMTRNGPEGEAEAAALLGRARIERKEFAAASFWLKTATQRYPQALRLWQLLAQASLSDGIDQREGASALRRILELDPGDEQARRTLAALQGKR